MDKAVNFLKKMTHKKLCAYITNLERAIEVEDDEKNIKLFRTWKKSAEDELNERYNNRKKFLQRHNLI